MEKNRKMTLFSKPMFITLEKEKHKTIGLNIIDTPGHLDFTTDRDLFLEITDIVIIVIDCC